MLKTKVVISRKKPWFLGKAKSKIEISTDISQIDGGFKAVLCAQLVRELFPFFESLSSGGSLENACGRNYASFTTSSKQNVRPGEEELWRLSGQLLELNDSTDWGVNFSSSSKEEKLKLPLRFTLERTSSFSSFKDNKDILYAIRNISSGGGNLLSQLAPSTVARLCPLLIQEARCGIEFFESKYTGSRFGMAPQLIGHFYWELSTDSISCSIYDENIDDIQQLPLARRELWPVLDRGYSLSGIASGLQKKVQQLIDADNSQKVECFLDE